MSGYGPSSPTSGAFGKATFVSMGTPSKLLTVLRGEVDPQKRTPASPACCPGSVPVRTSHEMGVAAAPEPGIGSVKTLVMSACAAGATMKEAATTAATAIERLKF